MQVEARRRALGRAHDRPRDALQQVLADLGALDEEDVQALVAAGGEQQRPRRQPVPPRAARLLVVGLDRARDGLVADGPHVGLVDAHPERVGGDDHRDLARHEAPLRLGTDVARQPGVVGDDLDAQLAPEPVRQPVALRARAGVDDRGQRVRPRTGRRDPPPHDLLVRALDDREREVRAVEPRRHVHRLAQPEARHDVGRDLRRRGRRRGQDRLRAEPARRVGEPEVLGPEVVPPLGDAVRLVDHEQAELRVPDALQEPRRREPLGRDVQQPHLAGDGVLDRQPVRPRVLLRVDQRDPAGAPRAPAPPPGPASATPAARRPASGPFASAPAAGSRATCPSRWASPPGRRGRRGPPRPPRAARAGTPGSRTAPPERRRHHARTPPARAARARPRRRDRATSAYGGGGSSSQASDTGWRPYRAPRSAPGARGELLQSAVSISTK